MTVDAPDIAVVSPLAADMRALIRELNGVLSALTPPGYCYHMTPEEMAGERTTVFLARLGGHAAACGALHRHEGGIGEVKRMYTRPAYQGRKLGGAILDQIIKTARRDGLSELVLETGDKHHAAWRTYERAGFTRCGPVLDYPSTPYSVFYRRPLVAEDEI